MRLHLRESWLAALLIGCALPATPQLLQENFVYASGQLTDLNGGANVSGGAWTSFSGTGNALMVVDANLSFPGYPGSGAGGTLRLRSTSTSAEDAYASFTPLPVGSTLFAAFLLNVDTTAGLAANTSGVGDHFSALLPGNSTTAFYGRLCIRKGIGPDTYQLGIRATSQNASAAWYETDLTPAETYLVILGYQLVDGDSNDVASLWLNPDLAGSQPSPVVHQVSTSTSEPAGAARFALRQDGSDTPTASIDGIRISEFWSEVALPVQLTAFRGMRVAQDVWLRWTTVSEVNNYGFFVERRCETDGVFSPLAHAFVPGHGTAVTSHEYTYTDVNVPPGAWFYRLRQVDLAGGMTFSDPVRVEILAHVGETAPLVFGLSQNHPNPFNPSTTIGYTTAHAGHVTLRVFDMLGRVVATLVDGSQPAGTHRVFFNAKDLLTGAYIASLASNGRTARIKLILAK
ncbi:MAG: T9SS type A sorting domain-containing protein [Bacteroidetes bacterium]|nr:T9SS type A sorting domain-containing protein [Bacteroidota bacterium]